MPQVTQLVSGKARILTHLSSSKVQLLEGGGRGDISPSITGKDAFVHSLTHSLIKPLLNWENASLMERKCLGMGSPRLESCL